jgi:1,2-diacylglycerol-3-alpha-glucose alpha-1,2-glucosyltransferase
LVPKETVRAALNAADLFLYLTREETEGIPLLEAFACQTPTLIRDIPVFAEYPDGIVTRKAKTLNQFAAGIRQSDDKLVSAARAEAEKKDVGRVGKQLAYVYRHVIKK